MISVSPNRLPEDIIFYTCALAITTCLYFLGFYHWAWSGVANLWGAVSVPDILSTSSPALVGVAISLVIFGLVFTVERVSSH